MPRTNSVFRPCLQVHWQCWQRIMCILHAFNGNNFMSVSIDPLEVLHVSPCVSSLEVTEVRVKGLDHVITDQVDHVHLRQTHSQLFGHFPEVLRQHLIQLALISTQGDVPRQNIVPIAVVKHCRERNSENVTDNQCYQYSTITNI